MKQLIVLLSLFVSFPALAITRADIPALVQTSEKLHSKAIDLANFSQRIFQLSNDNFSFSVAGSTVTSTLTVQQQQDLLNYYNKLKNDLQILVNQLP